MKKSNVILVVIILAFCLSCSEGLFDQIGKPIDDPVVVKPVVRSFEDEETIIITWDDDAAADEYILYRNEVPDGSRILIYRGTENSYIDKDFIEYLACDNVSFNYSLSKIRGMREFGPSSPALGIFSRILNDSFEPNNHESLAHELSTARIQGNVYYFRDEYDNLLLDEDWFFMNLLPREQATVVLTQIDDTSRQYFQYQVAGSSSIPYDIIHNDGFFIFNDNNYPDKIFFEIIPNISNFMQPIETNGGSQRGYFLKLTERDS